MSMLAKHPLPSDALIPPALLDLKIRFSHSELPDLYLPLPFPAGQGDAGEEGFSISNLKARIRAALPEGLRKHGLKLIYAGRVLDGRDGVARALKLPLPLVPNGGADGAAGASSEDTNTATTNGKGKSRPLKYRLQEPVSTVQ